MNRKKCSWKNLVGASGPLALAFTIGCESERGADLRDDRWMVVPWYRETGAKPEPAPPAAQAQQTRPAEPAPQPAAPPPVARAASHWWPTMKDDRSLRWSAMAFPTSDPLTSVIGIEKGMPNETRLNQKFNYKILVTNLTTNTLESVVLYEDFGKNLEYYSANPTATTSGGRVSWMLGSMAPRETKSILVSATPTAEGTVGACASVTYATAFCANVPVVAPQLKIVKTGPAEVIWCDEIVYNIEVSNTGTGTMSNVKVVDALPRGLLTVEGRNAFEAAVGTLAAGEVKRYSFRAKAESKGKFENLATATGDDGLKAESSVVSVLVREPALKIARSGPTEGYISVPLTYEITVTNTGDAAALDTVLEEAVPTGAVLVNASDNASAVGGKVLWKLGTLAVGGSKKVTLTLRGDQPVSIRGVATAKAYCAQAVTASMDTAVRGIPAILLEVVDLSDPIKVGENVTYQITVTNQGSAVDRNIRLVCTLEENQQFVSVSGATSGSVADNVITLQPLAQLAPKGQAVWSVTVRNVTPGDVRFKVSMKSDNLTRNVEETEATNVWR